MKKLTKHPIPKFGALVLNKKGEVLLVKLEKYGGKPVLIGGFLEHGKPLNESVVEQVEERTGLKVEFEKVFLIQDNRFENPDKEHYLYVDCLCQVKSGKVELKDDDYLWVKPKKALDLDLEKCTRNSIKTYLS